MSNIRRQSIISSGIVYFGFALGLINTYLFTREGSFTTSQYGLVNTFVAIANVMYSVAALGMPAFIYKFYPYYNDNLPPSKNDMITWALVVCSIGFTFVAIAGISLKGLVVKKYVTNAPDIIRYYYWLFPFGFGLTVFTVLEAFAWQLRKSVFTTFLREVQFRLLTTILIVLFFVGFLPRFDNFIKVYSFTYLIIAVILLAYMAFTKRLYFRFSFSRVTKKFWKRILTLTAFVWSGGIIFTLSNVFDSLVIAAVIEDGLVYVGIYSLAQNIASLIQAPQRGIISASIAPLSQAWKDKDFARIKKIYYRSSINQLIFSITMFVLIYINFTDGILTFDLRDTYVQALPVFVFIGMMRILDMGTGLNAQIIGTSTFWRFEFFTGLILLATALPLNYLLTKWLGVTGPAISNLIAFTIYNTIRCLFLYRKFGMHPFSVKSLYTVGLGVLGYVVAHYSFNHLHGFWWIVIRSLTFLLIFGTGVILLRVSPDLIPVIGTIRKKVGLGSRGEITTT